MSLQEGWGSGRSFLLPSKDFAKPGIPRAGTPDPGLRGLWEPTPQPAPGTLVYPFLQRTPGTPGQSSGYGSRNIASCPGIRGQGGGMSWKTSPEEVQTHLGGRLRPCCPKAGPRLTPCVAHRGCP